ncbi:MAG: C39 family peptidase [Planctomycetota bacterium]
MPSRETARGMLGTACGGLLAVACLAALTGRQASAQYSRAPIRDGDHIFQRHVCSWLELKQQNIVMQKRDYSCGAAALATLVKYFWGDEASEQLFLNELDKMLTPEEARDRVENGLALTDLRRVAVKSGYQASIGRLEFGKLVESKVPLILGLSLDGYDHFVVYRGWDGYYVYLADPIRGNVRVPGWEFVRQWQKNAILVVAKPGQEPPEASALSLTLDEVCLGRLNRELVRKQVTRRLDPFPKPVLP